MTTGDYLKTQYTQLTPREVLQSPPTVLLGVSPAAASALQELGITTVFDLASSHVFANATQLVQASLDASTLLARYGTAPSDVVLPKAAQGLRIDELPSQTIGILEGIGPTKEAALAQALDVQTVRDLALWPPYLAARTILQTVFSPENLSGFDPEAPADLLPKSGEYPTERIFYTTLVLDQIEDNPDKLQALEAAGPIDISQVTAADFGFKKPGVGAQLRFAQSWYAQGVALGQLLHSVALAPGESTRLAVVDWSRRSHAGTSEDITEAEDLSNSTQHSRSISEVTSAVANEAQGGFSGTQSSSKSEQGGQAKGESWLDSIMPGDNESTSSGTASTQTQATSWSSSWGERDLSAKMSQNVMDSTQQHANAVRNRRASIVREVSQEEHDSVSTRVVTNYNHMHALTIQYYEVVQVHRVAVQLVEVQPCLFIPMKLVDFRNPAIIDRFRLVLAAATPNAHIRALLTNLYHAVEIVPVSPPAAPFSSKAVMFTRSLAVAARTNNNDASSSDASSNGASKSPRVSELLVKPQALTSLSISRPLAIAQAQGWDHVQLSAISALVNRAILLPTATNPFLPEEMALVGVSVAESPLEHVWVERRDGSRVDLTQQAGGTPLGELSALLLDNTTDQDISEVTLHLNYFGSPTSLKVPITLPKHRSNVRVIQLNGSSIRNDLSAYLEANRLYYSQAIYRSLDAASLALLLSPYKYRNKPVTQLIDPVPVAVAGNYLVFSMHIDQHDQQEAANWLSWQEKHGIDLRQVKEEIVPLPSGGVFAEAVLGRFNAAEKLDITRFWHWQDSPIPIAPPDIAAVQTGSRAQPEDLKPGQLSQPLVNIVNPTALPDPTGLSAVLQAISNGNMFRDMSGLAATIGLAQAGMQATQQGATAAGQQAGTNFATSTQANLEMVKALLSLASQAMSQQNANATPSTVSNDGAKINYGKQMDMRGATQGAGGATTGGNVADKGGSSQSREVEGFNRAVWGSVEGQSGIRGLLSNTGLLFRDLKEDPNSKIPVAKFIDYVRAVEQAYSSYKPEEILTLIRELYYFGSNGFDQTVKDAPKVEFMDRNRVDPDAYNHLAAHANENGIQDNPSPYIVMPNGEQIDVGHLFFSLDSLLHPAVDEPYISFGIPGIDLAGWIADLALAVYWTVTSDRPEAVKDRIRDKVEKQGNVTYVDFYKWSAPDEDLLGDADSFGLFEQWNARAGQTLSQVLRSYYLGDSGTPPRVNQRWRIFCNAKDSTDHLAILPYNLTGTTISWDSRTTLRWIARINRVVDLFDAGKLGAAWVIYGPKSVPSKRSWPYSQEVLSMFLDWIKTHLEAELRSP